MVEVKHVFERAGVLIAQGQVLVDWAALVIVAVVVAAIIRNLAEAQKAVFDEGQDRGVAARGVRDVVRLGKGRNGQERDAQAELVEGRAAFRVGAGGIGGQLRAKFDRVIDRRVGFA